MSLLKIHFVEDPSTAKSDSGYFIRVTYKSEFISDLPVNKWYVHALSSVGGVLMPSEERLLGGLLMATLVYISKWNQTYTLNKHMFITPEAASLLLPEMARPRVPFALMEFDSQIIQKCKTVIHNSLDFAIVY